MSGPCGRHAARTCYTAPEHLQRVHAAPNACRRCGALNPNPVCAGYGGADAPDGG